MDSNSGFGIHLSRRTNEKAVTLKYLVQIYIKNFYIFCCKFIMYTDNFVKHIFFGIDFPFHLLSSIYLSIDEKVIFLKTTLGLSHNNLGFRNTEDCSNFSS